MVRRGVFSDLRKRRKQVFEKAQHRAFTLVEPFLNRVLTGIFVIEMIGKPQKSGKLAVVKCQSMALVEG